jgi:hypothetical protein
MDNRKDMNIFNQNFYSQKDKSESNQIEEDDEDYDKNNPYNNSIADSMSYQTNESEVLRKTGNDKILSNDDNEPSNKIFPQNNSGDIKLKTKEMQYNPMKNPENKVNIVNPFQSVNPEMNNGFNIDGSINKNCFNQEFKSVESKTVPKSIAKNSNIYELYPKPQFNNIQIDAKAILNSLNDQKTTIILQKILMESNNEQIKSIVLELQGRYRQLILDKNGNFFCKDLFKICDQKERIIILKELSPTLSEDCCNNFGTHPIQALIEFSSSEEEYTLILRSFNDYNKLLFATLDPNGAYVIQKIIIRIPERFRGEFNFIFSSFICFVCKQKFGIVTVKKFIECTKSEGITQNIMNLIKTNFMNFAVDKYGNYLIQFILEKWGNFNEGIEIKELIFKNFNVMCKSKYSSFICELYVKMLNNEEKNELIKTLDINEIKNSNNGNKILKYLGIHLNNDNNGINNYQNQFQLPLSLNNNNNINITSQPNFMNYGNQNNNNNGNNNYGNRNFFYRPNNKNNKHKK